MKNPFGYILGLLWVIIWRVHKYFHPNGGQLWMPIWVQPYWMRAMGWEVNVELIQYYERLKKSVRDKAD